MLDGGALCAGCRRGRRAVISVSPVAIAALRGLADATAPPADVGLEPPVGGEVRAIMNAYLTHVLDRPAGAARWLPHQQPPRRRRSG
jgi:hypothetical protein